VSPVPVRPGNHVVLDGLVHDVLAVLHSQMTVTLYTSCGVEHYLARSRTILTKKHVNCIACITSLVDEGRNCV